MNRFFVLAALCLAPCFGQAVRIDPAQASTISSAGTQPYGYPQVLAIPGAAITLCGYPANGFPCTNLATAYTDATASTQCPSGKPVVPAGSSICVATADAQGRFGFWVVPGSYAYMQTINGRVNGPFPVTVGSSVDALAILAQPAGASLIGYLAPGSGTVPRTVAGRLNDVFDVKNFGVVSDGTDQSAKFQAAIAAIAVNGGGGLFIPYSPNCYIVSAAVKVASNTTVFSDARTTCVKKMAGTQPTCSDPGCNSVFYTDTLTQAHNVHFSGFTVDGNRANITGISGDGGNFGILFENAFDSGIENMTVQNAYTGGVTVSCGESPLVPANVGNNVIILNSIITNSRRNNLEAICGTNTRQIGGENSYSNGGSLSVGADAEPDIAGQLISGFQMLGVNVHHNQMGGVLIQPAYDTAPAFSITDVSSHDNGLTYGGLRAVNFNGSGGGYLAVSGGRFQNNGAATAAVSVTGFKFLSIDGGAVLTDSLRGLFIDHDVNTATLGSSFISGSTRDLEVTAPNSLAVMAGVELEHNTFTGNVALNQSNGVPGISATVSCTAGQHVNALTVVGGLISVTPTCN